MITNNIFNAFSLWWKDITTSVYSEVKTGSVSTTVGFTSASFLILSYLMLTCSRLKVGDAVVWVLYCLIGDLCNLTGAFLANQTYFQCFMASIMASMDVVNFISVVLPICFLYRSSTGKRMRILTRRRRQNFLVICLLFGVGGCVFDRRVHHIQAVRSRSPASRKLLNVIVHDQTELLGYVLGLLSFAISWTSRIPFFLKVSKGDLSQSTHIFSRVFSAIAGALYATAIVLYDPRLDMVVKAMPWILSGASCAILDSSILLLSCYRLCYKRQSVRTQNSDRECLLGGLQRHNKDKTVRKHISSWKSSSTKNSNVQPVRKVCLKKVTITRDNSAENQPLKGSVKVVRVDERYSSVSTSDSSCISSELETELGERALQWDFEETRPQWSSTNKEKEKTDAFPLQKWTVSPRAKSNMSSSLSACFCNSANLEERVVSGSSDTNFSSISDAIQ